MPETFLTLRAVEQRTSYKKTAIYEMAKAGTFPRPIKIGPNKSVWLASTVDAWINGKVLEAAA